MTSTVSIIIPNRNGAATIGRCLEAAFATEYPAFEVIVVDDSSSDRSTDLIGQFPCKLVPLATHSGASVARNTGVQHSSGDLLFFTDADCLLKQETIAIAVEALSSAGANVVLGGSYSDRPVDDTFFSRFQSIYVAYNETRNSDFPDYIATHAMMIAAQDFARSGGFAKDFLPILEDVEFSHRMKRQGFTLLIDPAIRVRHIFDFSIARSMRNAFRKSMFWTAYSINNKDLFKDSGTASLGLKVNAAAWLSNLLLVLFLATPGKMLVAILLITGINLVWNRGLLAAFLSTGGVVFLSAATAYYVLVYPLAVGSGSVAGMLRYRSLTPLMRNTG